MYQRKNVSARYKCTKCGNCVFVVCVSDRGINQYKREHPTKSDICLHVYCVCVLRPSFLPLCLPLLFSGVVTCMCVSVVAGTDTDGSTRTPVAAVTVAKVAVSC